MTDPSSAPSCDSGERLLARLEAQRRPAPSERMALTDDVRAAVVREAAIESAPNATDRERYQAQLETWRAIHRFMHQTPFRDRARASRSDQWRAVVGRVRGLGEPGLLDWVLLQVEVANNRERGIADMRPRKNGPTFLVLLEYVANRKRKALALLKWAVSADREGWLTSNSGTTSGALREWHRQAAARNPGNERL